MHTNSGDTPDILDEIETLVTRRQQTCNRWTVRLFGTRRNALPAIATVVSFMLFVLFDTSMFADATIHHSITNRLLAAGGVLGAGGATCAVTWARWKDLDHIKQDIKDKAYELPYWDYDHFRLEQTLIDLGSQMGSWNLVCQFGLTRHSELVRTLIHSAASQDKPDGWDGTEETYRNSVRTILQPPLRPVLDALDGAPSAKWGVPAARHTDSRTDGLWSGLENRVRDLLQAHTTITTRPDGVGELAATMIAGHDWTTWLNVTETVELAAALYRADV